MQNLKTINQLYSNLLRGKKKKKCRLLSHTPGLVNQNLDFNKISGNPSSLKYEDHRSKGFSVFLSSKYIGCCCVQQALFKDQKKQYWPVFPYYLPLPKLLPRTNILIPNYLPGKLLHTFENQQLRLSSDSSTKLITNSSVQARYYNISSIICQVFVVLVVPLWVGGSSRED